MHTFEPAASGRSKCRGCGRPIAVGELRFGERLANPFADGEMVLWFHPICAAYKRPESMLEALAQSPADVDIGMLERIARRCAELRRLPRIDGAERARGQAACRQCREPIPKGDWRVRLVYFEEGRFHPSGFIHVACVKPYFETDDIVDQLLHFSDPLDDELRNWCQVQFSRREN